MKTAPPGITTRNLAVFLGVREKRIRTGIVLRPDNRLGDDYGEAE